MIYQLILLPPIGMQFYDLNKKKINEKTFHSSIPFTLLQISIYVLQYWNEQKIDLSEWEITINQIQTKEPIIK